ncbi:hypothetical protein EYF80_048533 [Liparis tanakae]|uniref:Uncharacterized protein n=1 Tax=Liparis tanakae TaxID=230148 RepID=A0A4Z2FKN5_9TELE|nr:hypothetical protein EYF80_048533 [Liparis tanakae]
MTSHLRELSDVSVAARRNGDDAPAQSAGRKTVPCTDVGWNLSYGLQSITAIPNIDANKEAKEIGMQTGPQTPSDQPSVNSIKPQQHIYQSPSVYQPKPRVPIRKPTQNPQQSRQTNPDAKDVIQSKAGMWDFVSPKNVKRIASQQPSYKPKPQQHGYKSPSVYQPKPQQAGYQSPSVYQPKPQQPSYPSLSVYQPKPQQHGYKSPSVYQPKPQQQIPKPTQNSQQSGQANPDAEGVIQTKAGMWDFVSPKNVKSIESQQTGYQPKPQHDDYQSPSVYQQPKTQQPGYPSLSVYQPQQQIPKPKQNSQQSGQTNPDAEGAIQSKAGMWDFVSSPTGTRFESGIASSREIVMQTGPQTPSEPQLSVYQPSVNSIKPQQHIYQPPSVYQPNPRVPIRKPTQNPQQSRQTNPDAKDVIQSKAGMWDFVSPKNEKRFESVIASSRDIFIKAGPPPPSEPQPSVYQPSVNSMKPRQAGYQSPSGYPPKPQQAGYQSQAIYLPKPQQAGYQSSSGYPPSSVYPRKTQQASYQSSSVYPPQPQQAGYQFQAIYPPKPQQAGYQSSSGYPPSSVYSPKPQQAVYQSQSIYPLKPQQAGYQPKPQPQIRKPTLNSKQAHQTNPDAEGVIQTKAGMWDFVSPNNEKRIESGISSSRGILVPSSPQPSVFQPKPHQPWSPSKHQQGSFKPKIMCNPGPHPSSRRSFTDPSSPPTSQSHNKGCFKAKLECGIYFPPMAKMPNLVPHPNSSPRNLVTLQSPSRRCLKPKLACGTFSLPLAVFLVLMCNPFPYPHLRPNR